MIDDYILLEEIDVSNSILEYIDKVFKEKVSEDGNIEDNNK